MYGLMLFFLIDSPQDIQYINKFMSEFISSYKQKNGRGSVHFTGELPDSEYFYDIEEEDDEDDFILENEETTNNE